MDEAGRNEKEKRRAERFEPEYHLYLYAELESGVQPACRCYRQDGRLTFLLRNLSNENKNDCFEVVFTFGSIAAKNAPGTYRLEDSNTLTMKINYNNQNRMPTGASGWYLPSQGQYQLYYNNSVDTQLATVGGGGLTKSGMGEKAYYYAGAIMT